MTPLTPLLRALGGAALVSVLCGCAALEALSLATPGERWRRWVVEQTEYCNRPRLSEAAKRGTPSCRILQKPREDPLATPEGRFAYSIKLPAPHDVPKDVYRPGMTSLEYYHALCKAEAGEFIFRTVENVEGIVLLRPRAPYSDDDSANLYGPEDPYGGPFAGRGLGASSWVTPNSYLFAESFTLEVDWFPPVPGTRHPSLGVGPSLGHKVARFYYVDTPDRKENWRKDFDIHRNARFGVTWRGISRPNDRDLGIGGGELIVLDLDTNEIVGFRRGFVLSGNQREEPGVSWANAGACPVYAVSERPGGLSRYHDSEFWFVSKVLVPPVDRPKAFGFQLPLLPGKVSR